MNCSSFNFAPSNLYMMFNDLKVKNLIIQLMIQSTSTVESIYDRIGILKTLD